MIYVAINERVATEYFILSKCIRFLTYRGRLHFIAFGNSGEKKRFSDARRKSRVRKPESSWTDQEHHGSSPCFVFQCRVAWTRGCHDSEMPQSHEMGRAKMDPFIYLDSKTTRAELFFSSFFLFTIIIPHHEFLCTTNSFQQQQQQNDARRKARFAEKEPALGREIVSHWCASDILTGQLTEPFCQPPKDHGRHFFTGTGSARLEKSTAVRQCKSLNATGRLPVYSWHD